MRSSSPDPKTGGMFLKVRVVDGAEDKSDIQYRSLEFTENTTGGMLISAFKERYNISDDKAWGLFLRGEEVTSPRPAGSKSPSSGDGIWLDPDKTLGSYGIKSRAVVDFRSTLRIIKISDLDNQLFSKTIQIAHNSSIRELLDLVAVRFAISNITNYQLQVVKDGDPSWVEPEARIADVLPACEDRMILRLRFLSARELECADPHFLDMLYVECRTSVIAGAHSTTLPQAVQFAALQMQITHGDYDPLTHVANFLDTREFLPFEHREVDLIEEDVYKEHRKLKGLKLKDAKLRYAKLLSVFPSFGITYWPAKEKTEKSAHYDHDIFLGVSGEYVVCMHPVSKVVMDRYVMHSAQDLRFDYQERKVEWATPQGTRRFQFASRQYLSEFLSIYRRYVDRMAKRQQQQQTTKLPEVGLGSMHIAQTLDSND